MPILSLIGIGISAYLTYEHYKNLAPICFLGQKCDAVLTSSYSQMWGIPMSLLGMLMYLALLAFSLLLIFGKKAWADYFSLGVYTLALASLLFTFYLYYLEIFEIQAFCTWCIGSSLVVLLLWVASAVNLFSTGIFRRGR